MRGCDLISDEIRSHVLCFRSGEDRYQRIKQDAVVVSDCRIAGDSFLLRAIWKRERELLAPSRRVQNVAVGMARGPGQRWAAGVAVGQVQSYINDYSCVRRKFSYYRIRIGQSGSEGPRQETRAVLCCADAVL